MIQPKEITIKTQAGDEKVFIISKFPATVGREIICKYPLSGLPKLGEYSVNEETMVKCLSHASAITEAGTELPLKNKAFIDNHVPDWETLVRLEFALLEYNCSFFQAGKISSFLDLIVARIEPLISKTLTDSLPQLSAKAKRRSKS